MGLDILQRLNTRKLSGCNRVLGLDISNAKARIVELEGVGGLLNRFKSSYKVVQSFTVEFNLDASLKARAIALQEAIARNNVKTKQCVTAVPPASVKSVMIEIPATVQDVDEWIIEHRERFLKMPTGTQAFVHKYEILGPSETKTRLEIWFTRIDEVEAIAEQLREAGLQVAAMGAGCRDAYNKYFLKNQENANFIHFEDGFATITRYVNGQLESRESVLQDLPEVIEAEKALSNNVLLHGEIEEQIDCERFVQFNLPSSYTLAAGLALKGFLPEESAIDFAPVKVKQASQEDLEKSLLRRTVLVCGVTLMFLLLLQSGLSWYLEKRIESFEESSISMQGDWVEIDALQRKVDGLEKEVATTHSNARRSAVSKLLHEIASRTEDGLWFTKLSLGTLEKGKRPLMIQGFARSNDRVSEFLKSLEGSALVSNPHLVQESSLKESDDPLGIKERVPQAITYEIKLEAIE